MSVVYSMLTCNFLAGRFRTLNCLVFCTREQLRNDKEVPLEHQHLVVLSVGNNVALMSDNSPTREPHNLLLQSIALSVSSWTGLAKAEAVDIAACSVVFIF